MSPKDDTVRDAKNKRRIAFADAALGAAGHAVTGPETRELALQVAAGKLTGDEAIARALTGTESYDALNEQERDIVRQEWAERMETLRGGLNYEEGFTAAGDSYSELDEDGTLVLRQPRG